MRATIFGAYAADYHRWRPSYPDEAVDWLLPPRATVVADVGAGTGKLTASLLARGLRVHAVEPDSRMLAVLRRSHPQAIAHEAGAGTLPLADGSVEAVLAADAFHWFPFEETVAETRRVLRPGGWLGLLWNVVAPVEPWEHELAALDPDYRPEPSAGEGPFPTGEIESATFPWAWETTPDAWCAYLRTLSAFVLMDPAERDRRLERAYTLVADASAARDSGTVAVRHEVFCARWRPPGLRRGAEDRGETVARTFS